MEEKQEKKAESEAIRFISLKERSTYEVVKKLKEKKYSNDIIDKIIKFLNEYRYLDDERYAEIYTNCLINSKGKGRNYIRKKLKERGIKPEIIESSLSEYSIEKEFEIALREAQRKRGKNPESLLLFLKQRGFSNNVIYRVISKIVRSM